VAEQSLGCVLAAFLGRSLPHKDGYAPGHQGTCQFRAECVGSDIPSHRACQAAILVRCFWVNVPSGEFIAV